MLIMRLRNDVKIAPLPFPFHIYNTRKEDFLSTFTYKKAEITTMKISGILNTDNMTVSVDGVDKELSTLLSDFNREYLEISIKTKIEEDLSEPC